MYVHVALQHEVQKQRQRSEQQEETIKKLNSNVKRYMYIRTCKSASDFIMWTMTFTYYNAAIVLVLLCKSTDAIGCLCYMYILVMTPN